MSRLTIAEFEAALDRSGADIESWPAELRAAALDLVANSAEARRMLEASQLIERELARPVPAPKGLADRIVGAALRASSPKPRR